MSHGSERQRDSTGAVVASIDMVVEHRRYSMSRGEGSHVLVCACGRRCCCSSICSVCSFSVPVVVVTTLTVVLKSRGTKESRHSDELMIQAEYAKERHPVNAGYMQTDDHIVRDVHTQRKKKKDRPSIIWIWDARTSIGRHSDRQVTNPSLRPTFLISNARA